ncbi:MAG: hypothetical protein KJ621_00355 [Proteobacteria bacterium]|nr:hypothetical protein [Pseudomonadota bacterium]
MPLLRFLEKHHEKLDQEHPELMRTFLSHCRRDDIQVNVGARDNVWEDVDVLWLGPQRRRVLLRKDSTIAMVAFDWIELNQQET